MRIDLLGFPRPPWFVSFDIPLFVQQPHRTLPMSRGGSMAMSDNPMAPGGSGPHGKIYQLGYMASMVLRSFGRGRPLNASAAFIHPCQPIVAKQPPAGPGWAHELKHDGYRLQIHVRDGRIRLYTMN